MPSSEDGISAFRFEGKQANVGESSDFDGFGSAQMLPLPPPHLWFLFFPHSHHSFLPPLSSHINSSPGYDWAVFLRLHVIVKVCVHFLFPAAVASTDMVGRRKDIPTSTPEAVIPLLLFLCAFIHVKLSPFWIVHLATQEDIMRGRRVWKMTVVVLAGLFH